MFQRALIGEPDSGGTATTGQVKYGTFSPSSSGTKTVTVGFRPKYLVVYQATDSSTGATKLVNMYDARISTQKALFSASNTSAALYSLGATTVYKLNSITSTGFIVNQSAAAYTYGFYFAATDE